VGRIAVFGAGVVPKASVLAWNKGAGAPLGTTPRLVTGYAEAVLSPNVFKSGSGIGRQCCPISSVDFDVPVGGSGHENSIVADVWVLAGDSGVPAEIGSTAVGVMSWSERAGGTSCQSLNITNGDYYGGFFPMDSDGFQSMTSAYGSTWEIAATVPTAVVTTPVATINNLTTISGTLDSGTAPNKVQLYVDGSSTASANVSAADGTWTAPIPSVNTGLHTYRIAATYGSYSTSAGSATGWFKVGFTSDRLAGADRFATSTAIMNAAYSPGVPVLYVTTGFNYPDARSAGPAAAHNGGPVLLVPPSMIGATQLAAITTINPAKIIVLGGSNGVSNTVFGQLKAIVSNTVRIAGTDRYDTSRLISRDAFIGASETGATHVFISNGGNFPDALSTGGAAASVNGAVVLVNGRRRRCRR
jgi:hypothetical protein